MKILLLQSPEDFNSPGNVKSVPPLSLSIIVSFLRKNDFIVKAYDLNQNYCKNYTKVPKEEWLKFYSKEFFLDGLNDQIEGNFNIFQYILEDINIDEFDFVGISIGSYGSFFEIHFSFLLGKLIQSKHNKPVVFGGANVGVMFFHNLFDEVLEIVSKNFKYIINGPGEISLVKLLRSYQNGSIDSVYPTLPGVIYVSNGKIIANKSDNPTFICPDYSDFNLDFYKTYFAGTVEDENVKQLYGVSFPFNIKISNLIKATFPNSNYSANIIPYYFNYNCHYKCAFCSQSGNTSKPITKGVREIIDDINFLKKQFNSKYFHFVNNTINFSPAFVRDFCTMIIDKEIKIYWSDCARVNGLTKELLELMYKAGCRKLVFGFESGSERLLKYINKKLDVKKVSEVLKWCSETGIYAELEVIVGLPYEYDEDFEATWSFIHKNKNYINFIYTTKYYVIRDSLIGTFPEKYGIELLQGETYESMLTWVKQLSINNFQYFPTDFDNILFGKTPFHVLKFNEINGRSNEIVEKETHKKFMKMIKLNNDLPGFTEMYKITNSLIRKKC